MRNQSRALLSCILLTAACGGDDGNQFGQADTGATDTGSDAVTADTTADTAADTTTDDADDDATIEDTTADIEEDTGGTGYSEAIYLECEEDTDCEPVNGFDQICVRSVCVIPPTVPAHVSNDEGDSPIEEEGTAPTVDCYAGNGLFEPAGENRDVTLTGIVERFGSGPTTEDLCLTVFDEEALLPWLSNSECNLLADGDEDAYIGCFQLDPCRCNEHFDGRDDLQDMLDGAEAAMEAAGTPMAVDTLDACNSFIGYCTAVEDADMRTACEARVAANGLTDANTLIHSAVRTVEDPEDSALDEPEGTSLYFVENVPTNWRYAVKVSGREARWRDTWEFGQFTRGDMVRDDDMIHIDATAVSAGAWATIPPAVGIAGGIPESHGALAGVVRDCGTDERNPWSVVHATVGISFNQDSVLSYFNGNPDNRLPSPALIDSNVLGTYAAIDLPPGPNRVAPVICVTDGAECTREDYVFAGAKNVFQTPRSVIIATFEGYFDL